MPKKSEMKSKLKFRTAGVWVLGIALALVLFAGGIPGLTIPGAQPQTREVTPVEFTQQGKTVCAAGVSRVVTTFNAFDTKNRGTATAEKHRVYVEDASGKLTFFSTVEDAATLNLPPGTKGKALMGNNSESTSTGYYPVVVDFTLGCDKGADVVSGYNKGKNTTKLTTSFFNSDDGLANSGADPQDLAANSEQTATFKLATSADRFYGDENIVLVFNANTSTVNKITMDGGDVKSISPPRQHTGASGARSYAFELPSLASTKLIEYQVTVASAATDPTSQSNITCFVYDKSWYVDADDNVFKLDYQDEDGGDVGSVNEGGAARGSGTGACVLALG